MGNYQKALENLYSSLEYYEDLEDLTGQADVYTGLSSLLYEDDPGQVLKYAKEYLALSLATNDSARIFDAYGWLGIAHSNIGDVDKGIENNMT